MVKGYLLTQRSSQVLVVESLHVHFSCDVVLGRDNFGLDMFVCLQRCNHHSADASSEEV